MTKSQETWDALRAENHALLGQVEKLTRARNVEIALIEDYGRVNAGLTQERDDLQLALSRCNETKTALQMNLREAHKERDGLASQNQAMRDALEYYADKDHFILFDETAWDTVSGEPANLWCDESDTAMVEDGSMAKHTLSLPDTSADILRARDARVNAELLYALAAGQDAFDGGTGLLPFQLRKIAEDLEQKK